MRCEQEVRDEILRLADRLDKIPDDATESNVLVATVLAGKINALKWMLEE